MPLQKLSTTDAFLVTDLEGASRADGVVRCAKKILADGAGTMARARNYAWALLAQEVSGASAGISAAPDGRSEALTAFTSELVDRVASGALALDPGKGVDAADLGPFAAVDSRSDLLTSTTGTGTLADALLAAGVTAAAGAALGTLEGRSVVMEGTGTAGPSIIESFVGMGARVVAIGTPGGAVGVPPDADPEELVATWVAHGDGLPAAMDGGPWDGDVLAQEADILVCGSKMGLIDHTVASILPHKVVIPCGPAPVTARGLATARGRDIVVLADFLTTLGPLLAFHPAPDATAGRLLGEARDQVVGLTAEFLGHSEGPYLAACYRAEEFLLTWRERLPFGRPLA